MVSLPINTYHPGWGIRDPWIKFYFERFTDPNEVFMRSEDPKKCGCQKVSCPDNMLRSKMACGFCGKKMSTWCIQDGPWGSCRSCFLELYCQSSLVSTIMYIDVCVFELNYIC